MEVHHHSHSSSRKKWTHYFWEFLMLFLAVFCGFMAENTREHMVENQREKKYMRMLVEDLATDTLDLHKAIGVADTVSRYSDSVVSFLRNYKPEPYLPFSFASQIGSAGRRQSLNSADRTSSQLKNSGAMRLIRKQEVSNSILQYWNQINETLISLDRYMIYRNASREIVFKLWVVPEVYNVEPKLTIDSVDKLRVFNADTQKWDELTNLLAMMGTITRNNHRRNLERQLSMARDLINFIKEEYNFK